MIAGWWVVWGCWGGRWLTVDLNEGSALCMVSNIQTRVGGGFNLVFCIFLYCIARQQTAQKASIYGHLREGYLRKCLQIEELANFILPSFAQDSSI